MKTLRLKMYDRPIDRVRTRDALPALGEPPVSPSRADVGRLWTGVLETLTGLPEAERAIAVGMIGDSLNAFAAATKVAAPARVGDRSPSMAATIAAMNQRAVEFWKPAA